MTRVKICGITRLEDALLAAEMGADLLGFNFYSGSKRYISKEICKLISAEMDQRTVSILKVGVFVNAGQEEIEATLADCRLDLAQLSGDEPPGLLAALGERGFKAIRPRSLDEALSTVHSMQVRKAPPVLLLDTHRAGEYGGTGQTADWQTAAVLARKYALLLAGGLTPENIGQAVRQVRPWGVDVASGVESAPGLKDQAKMEAFIRTAKYEDVEEIEC
jgi:phosphoribosylanthranilate isomerase